MKIFVMLIAVVGLVNSQTTNQQFSDRIIRNINGALPSIEFVVQGQVRPFETDLKNGISHMVRHESALLETYGVLSPTPEWSEFTNANLKAAATYNETIDGTTSKAAIKKHYEDAVKELKDAVTNAFQQAPKIENQTLACRYRLIPAVRIYTTRLQINAYNLASGSTVRFIQNATNERSSIRNSYAPFYNNVTICHSKFSLEQRKSCLLTLLDQSGPGVTQNTRNIGDRIKGLFERAYKAIKDQMNALAKTVQSDLMKAMNAACPKLV